MSKDFRSSEALKYVGRVKVFKSVDCKSQNNLNSTSFFSQFYYPVTECRPTIRFSCKASGWYEGTTPLHSSPLVAVSVLIDTLTLCRFISTTKLHVRGRCTSCDFHCWVAHERVVTTRKLSYRKDDRAMRPIYGCPGKFRES